MSYNVRLGSSTSTRVKLAPNVVYVRTKLGELMAKKFDELIDVDVTNVSDKYIIMYDAVTEKYTAVNPDEVLVASSTSELNQPGLPVEFINTLDIDLDNKIDLDAGEF